MNKAVKVAVIITAVLIIVLAVTFLIIHIHFKSQVIDGDGMVNTNCYLCEYSVNGGMDGSSLYICVEQVDDRQAKLEYDSIPYAGGQEINKSIIVDIEVLDQVRDIYNRYGVREWGTLPESECYALDAPVTTVHFEAGDKSIIVSSNMELPDNGYQLMSELYEILISYVEE